MFIKPLLFTGIYLIVHSVTSAQSKTNHKVVSEKTVATISPTGTQPSFRPGAVKRVVILGNSITVRTAYPEIGWHNTWGMAASVQDSDYVHRLIRDIHNKQPSVIVDFKFIAEFERRYRSYDLSRFDSIARFKPDLLIIRISENVNDKQAIDSGFISYYDKMIKRIDPDNKAVKVIVGGFWKKDHVNKLIADYAASKGYPFIPNDHLFDDETNTAKGLFSNAGVAKHPSDKGMRLIEQSIWDYIKIYF